MRWQFLSLKQDEHFIALVIEHCATLAPDAKTAARRLLTEAISIGGISFYAGQALPQCFVCADVNIKAWDHLLSGLSDDEAEAVCCAINKLMREAYEVKEWLTPLDPNHPTTVGVAVRAKDFANEKTDNRQSVSYIVVSPNQVLEIEFHEGQNPAVGTNGFLTEDLLAILTHRMKWHQGGPFANRHNALCVTALEEAGLWLYARRRDRQAAGTSGTQKV